MTATFEAKVRMAGNNIRRAAVLRSGASNVILTDYAPDLKVLPVKGDTVEVSESETSFTRPIIVRVVGKTAQRKIHG
jgi:hypothetical protein